jgi:hypothetical protein
VPPRVIDVIDIKPLVDLGDIAKLGLRLSEAKQILARLQQVGTSEMWGDGGASDMTGRLVAGWGFVDGSMGWVLRLVDTGIDSSLRC